MGLDEGADRGVVAEVSPAQDRAGQVQPVRVLAAELRGDIEGLVVGPETGAAG